MKKIYVLIISLASLTFTMQSKKNCTKWKGSCKSDSDCCSGYQCKKKSCETTCTLWHGECTKNSDCCEGLTCDQPKPEWLFTKKRCRMKNPIK